MSCRKVLAESYPARIESLLVPPADEVKTALSKALYEDYGESSVEIVDCPNLRDWGLPAELPLQPHTRVLGIGKVIVRRVLGYSCTC